MHFVPAERVNYVRCIQYEPHTFFLQKRAENGQKRKNHLPNRIDKWLIFICGDDRTKVEPPNWRFEVIDQ